MKPIIIYKRKIPYKGEYQFTILYKDKEVKNHDEAINNPKLKVKFEKVLETKSHQKLGRFILQLGRSESEQWLKNELEIIYYIVS